VSWAVANDVNIVTFLRDTRPLTDAYRSEWATRGKLETELPLLGLTRHIVIADTDAQAQDIAQRAYRPWRRNMELLWEQRGVPFPLQETLPHEFDRLQRSGHGFAGNPAAARDYIAEQAEAGGVNYVVCDMAFGNIAYDEASRSVELFAQQVMPAFAQG
jgi:alkanesulfonate monooxygenase SsuD/methylene tetrahydromethanopterin reductase-like flavin-dependent oxidoreductase (luciferase family)